MIGLAFKDKQKENEAVVLDPIFSVGNNEHKLPTENFEIPLPPSPNQRKLQPWWICMFAISTFQVDNDFIYVF